MNSLMHLVRECTLEELDFLRHCIELEYNALHDRVNFIESIPIEITYRIFKYLSVYDLLQVSRVSKRWNSALNCQVWHEKCKLLHANDVNYSDSPEISDQSYWRRKCIESVTLDEHWRTFQPKQEMSIDMQGTVTDIALNGDFLAVGVRDDLSINVYHQREGQWMLCFQQQGLFVTSCLALDVKNDDASNTVFWVAAGSYSGELALIECKLWTMSKEPNEIRRYRQQGHVRPILCCMIYDSHIFTGGTDNTIISWRIDSSDSLFAFIELGRLSGHASAVVELHAHEQCLVSLGVSCSVLLWNDPYFRHNLEHHPVVNTQSPCADIHVGLVLGFATCLDRIAIVTETKMKIYHVRYQESQSFNTGKADLVLVAELCIFDVIPPPSLLELRLIKIGLNARGFIVLTTSNRKQSWIIDIQSFCGIQSSRMAFDHHQQFHLIRRGPSTFSTPNLSHKLDSTRFIFVQKRNGTCIVVWEFQ